MLEAPTTPSAIVVHGDGADYAYRHLRSAIVEQRFLAGQRLVEQRLSEELGVSRTPIREALRRLDAEGLVTVTANRGATVRGLTIDEVADLYGLRAQLESYAAGLATERMSPEELVELTLAVEAFGAACEHAGDRAGGDFAVARDLSAANARVHDALVVGAHHTRLQTMLQGTVDVPLVFGAFRVFGPPERRRSDVFHRLILEAVAQHDRRRACQLMVEHVALGCDAVVAALREAECRTTDAASGEASGSTAIRTVSSRRDTRSR